MTEAAPQGEDPRVEEMRTLNIQIDSLQMENALLERDALYAKRELENEKEQYRICAAEVIRLVGENAKLREALEAFAEHDCTYGDNCPTGARHGTCTGCEARAALDPSSTGNP